MKPPYICVSGEALAVEAGGGAELFFDRSKLVLLGDEAVREAEPGLICARSVAIADRDGNVSSCLARADGN